MFSGKRKEKSMEESNSVRKRTRRRCHTRKAALGRSFVDMAEARREIVSALQLHRSSSAVRRISDVDCIPAVLCGSSSHGQSYYRRQLTDSMPAPEPTWSTTAPAVLCAPVPALEVAWFDNVASSSSYSWWLGFLKSLDGKRDAVSGSADGFGPCLGPEDVGKSASDVSDQSPSPGPFTDEWLVVPAGEERDERPLHSKDI